MVYVAKCHGEYIVQNGRDRILRSYEATFRLPNASAPLAMIKGRLLMPFLRKLDSGAVAPYSWYLDEINPETGEFDPDELPVMFQSFRQLKLYCARHKLPVPVEEYGNLEMCRAHVELARDDIGAFHIVYAKHKEIIDTERELEILNNSFEGIGVDKGEVAVDSTTGAVHLKDKNTAPIAGEKKLPRAKVKVPTSDDTEDAILK